jgi:hypothetical protein
MNIPSTIYPNFWVKFCLKIIKILSLFIKNKFSRESTKTFAREIFFLMVEWKLLCFHFGVWVSAIELKTKICLQMRKFFFFLEIFPGICNEGRGEKGEKSKEKFFTILVWLWQVEYKHGKRAKHKQNEIIWPELKYKELKKTVFAVQSRGRRKEKSEAFSRDDEEKGISLDRRSFEHKFEYFMKFSEFKALESTSRQLMTSHLPLRTTQTIIKHWRQPFIVKLS